MLVIENTGTSRASNARLSHLGVIPGCMRCWKSAVLAQSKPSFTFKRNGLTRVIASLSYNNAAESAAHTFERAARTSLRLAIPSKGRMAEDTIALLEDCQLKVYKPNPRQYTATIRQMPELEVWFQRATDVVRKLLYRDVDFGIVGYDMYMEIADTDPELIVVHDALGFGGCHLGLGIPTTGKFADINSLEELRKMPDWTETKPLRVVTGYHNIARRFFEEKQFEHVVLLSADGALEAAPLMGSADIILDLVSTGVTLRENNLKEIKGGTILESQGVLVANKRSLKEDPRLLQLVRELIERFEAHLKADKYYSVVANMRGESAEEVAARICDHPVLRGLQCIPPTRERALEVLCRLPAKARSARLDSEQSLLYIRQGPTIGQVFPPQGAANGPGSGKLFSATICIPKTKLYESIGDLRKIGGSGVLVQPMTYIFEEEPQRWRQLLDTLGLD